MKPLLTLAAFLALLGSAGSAIGAASDAVPAVTRQLAVRLVTSRCDPGMLPNPESASNEQLHFCQYVKEEVKPDCVANRTCMTYETWTQANPIFSPKLSRKAFLMLLEQRQHALDGGATK